ncbi:hypothetical protein OCU04_005057 [Sclerotinia nivalis]|uniref:Methyltransferase domain-containing protein n=1 Tax=Sclerotinia nivalis TaxID=352851 RepID=A0A9X0DLG4_9HELO|nr:hypothetical protein OCU04_005057 [Sclerotinia nivalis]
MNSSKPYIFNRTFNSSVRLNYNHWLVKEACGYLLHPYIQESIKKDDVRIADVGTGTGIWLLELSETLPTATLDGYDISAAQYPPSSFLPPNVSLHTHDAFTSFPIEKLGSYDIVHLRFSLCFVNDEDAEGLLRNLVALLKPGGYLQWFEPDALATEVNYSDPNSERENPSVAMKELRDKWRKPREGSSYNWLTNLPSLYAKNGLEFIDRQSISQQNRHKQLWAHSNLLGFEDLIHNSQIAGTETEDKMRRFMDLLNQETARGISCDTPWVCVVGRKI